VPLYTYFIHDTSQFGYYDVCFALCLLLLPFVTLQLRDGAFRYLLECDETSQRQRIVTFVTRALTTTMTIAIVIALIVSCFTHVALLGYVVALLIAMSLQEVYSQVFRGLGNNRAFVTVGIISAFGIGILSVVLVAWLGLGIKGVFLANIIARLVAVAAVEARVRLITGNIKWHINTRQVGHDIMHYCLPLLPGALCWWMTGSSDRLFIEHYLGLDVNGTYAVATRFTGIIQTLAIIFYQAWQETAILQYHSADRDRFFSNMLNGYIFVLAAILVGYAFALKLCYGWLVADNYAVSLNYIYPLGISAVIFAVAAFFDMGYQCAKETARTLPAIVLAAVVNIALNFMLIKWLGVYGVITTLLVTYIVLVVYRWHDMKRYFKLTLQWRTLVPVSIIVVSTLPFYLLRPWWLNVLWVVGAMMLLLWSCPDKFKREIGEKLLHKRASHIK